MKIDKKVYLNMGLSESMAIENLWRSTAREISMEHGIFVDVKVENGLNGRPCHYWFTVMGHDFESLNELKKAIANKAFL